MKAQRILDAEPSTSRIKNIVLHLVGLYMKMSFLDSIGHIMAETGLKVLFSVVYAENTVPHMITRAIRAHTFADCSRYI